MIKEKTTAQIIEHKKKVLALYNSTGKDLYQKIADECQAELDLRAQKKTEETQEPAQKDQGASQGVDQTKQTAERTERFQTGTRGGKSEEVRQWENQNRVPPNIPVPEPSHKTPTPTVREFIPGLFMEELATLGELTIEESETGQATLAIKMVNGKTEVFTYGTIKARARYYFKLVMETKPFQEERYTALSGLDLFKNLVRLVKGWGVLKSLDENRPQYPAIDEIFKIQRQTRSAKVDQASFLLKMVLEAISKQ